MPSIYDIKPLFQKTLRPLSEFLYARGVTPNQITISAIILSFLGGIALALNPTSAWALWLIPFILLIRMMLNAIDGMIAREHHLKTHLGTFLNEIGDVISDSFLYLAFCFIPGLCALLIVSIVILAIISEMTGVVSVQIGASRRYDGPMGKSDRAFVFGLMAVLIALGLQIKYWLNIFLFIILVLLIITIINRVYQSLKEIRHGT